ncbi:MAG: hypothetical protein Q7R47_05825, partial [Candidatus Diapherotrites archaeon]|nr:hypothetical protein [Candidatus Diapherotrites archaeon]
TLDEKNLLFRGGETYSSYTLSRSRGLNASCITMDASELENIDATSTRVTILRDSDLTVYYQCHAQTATECASVKEQCPVCCTVSFGKRPA